MFIPKNIQTLFEILPNEIILGILFLVFRDNDENIRKAIPYLIPFLDDPISQSKRRFKPEIINVKYYSMNYSYSNSIIGNYIRSWVQEQSRTPRYIEEASSDYHIISNNSSYALISIPKNKKKKKPYKRPKTQTKQTYRTIRKQEMKFRNKQQRQQAKCSRR